MLAITTSNLAGKLHWLLSYGLCFEEETQVFYSNQKHHCMSLLRTYNQCHLSQGSQQYHYHCLLSLLHLLYCRVSLDLVPKRTFPASFHRPSQKMLEYPHHHRTFQPHKFSGSDQATLDLGLFDLALMDPGCEKGLHQEETP